MGKKRTEIIIETERVIFIKRRAGNSTSRCDRCGAPIATPPAEDLDQERNRQRDEPVRDSADGRSEVYPERSKKRFAITGD
jgi:hypothetical protein